MNEFTTSVDYSLLKKLNIVYKYISYFLVVYSYGDQRKIPYANNNTSTNNILLKRFSNPILP